MIDIQLLFAFVGLMILTLLFIKMAESYSVRLNAYRRYYGFNRDLEKADLTKIKDECKQEKRIDTRFKIFEKHVKAIPPRAKGESLIAYWKRRYYL